MENKNNNEDPENDFPGYPPYPPSEDIYITDQKMTDVDPENPELKKTPAEPDETAPLTTGEDLDVPGAELDDNREDIGNEDEENNYYSLGGDNHDNLDEDHVDYPS